MAIESGDYIDDFDPSKPGPADPKSEGDDHIRMIKRFLKNSFPSIGGPVLIAHDQFASKDYVNQAAFASSLPTQPGGATMYRLITQNGTATWQLDSTFSNNLRLAEAHAVALSF